MTCSFSKLSDYKQFARMDPNDNSEDSSIEMTLEYVTSIIQSYLQQTIFQDNYVEILSGTNTPYVRLRQGPIISITNVWEDTVGSYGTAVDAFSSATLLTQGIDYAAKLDQSSLLVRLNGVWQVRFQRVRGLLSLFQGDGFGNYKVSYTAGYATVPKDLAMATNLVVQRIRGMVGGQFLAGETTPKYSYTLQAMKTSDLLEIVKPQLAKFKRLYI